MYFRTLGLALFLFSQMSFADGRKPAVEDFVGIEVEQAEHAPQGTEGLFNFEKDMDKFVQTKGKPLTSTKTDTSIQSTGPSATTTAVAVAFMLGLPLIIWSLMMHHLRQKAHIESASNIEVLENYRKQRSAAKKAQEEYKKTA